LKVSVVIPTMNEEKSIGTVLDDVNRTMSASEYDFEAIIVDTNSKDRTKEIALSKGAKVVEEPRRGYGRAYKSGFEKSTGEIIATLDADCTYPAEDIPKLCGMLLTENLDFITTDRFADMEEGAMSGMHRFGNKVLTTTSRLLFSVKYNDSQSGMWIIRRSILSELKVEDDGMPFSEEIKIEAFRKVRSKEVPIVYRKRVGEVKLSSWKDGWKNFKFLWKKRF
jgi:glycosyltransferase involved in cell wall biosynthesis